MLAWWRHAAPPEARLRVLLAFEGDALIAVAPFYSDRWHGGMVRYRLLASGASMPVELICRPEFRKEAARLFADMLCRVRPRPDLVMLEGIPSGSAWPGLLRQAWPERSRPLTRADFSWAAPTLDLSGRSYPTWMASQSRHFRKHMGQDRRGLERAGAQVRLVRSTTELDPGLRAFARLHHSRWTWRGGSSVLTPGIEAMLADAGARLLEQDRFRLWSIEVDGQSISSNIFLAAGGEVAYWQGGFAEEWARYHPSMRAIMAEVEHACQVGDDHMDFGPGAQFYKYRFADGENHLDGVTLIPRWSTGRYLWVRLHLAPKHLYRAVVDRMSPQMKDRLRKIVPRAPSWLR
jgi:CelD/BcsL family acetyltransferase involved in cellulose biosynthesis